MNDPVCIRLVDVRGQKSDRRGEDNNAFVNVPITPFGGAGVMEDQTQRRY